MTDEPSKYRGYVLPLLPGHFRALREGAGLSQASLAQWADVADRSVRRWDASHRAPEKVGRFVVDRWLDVCAMAADTVALAPGDGPVLLLTGGTDEERAVTRLAMYEFERAGRTVRLTE
ncbi:hypothetical protein RB608_12030 [Nocardioides sp. LHD-245]|uniref:helix-turn-helix domain-containing protein n=1 Tax=Nocardioides sp. LHD-245 TaxID=3051387 RepID=UPI0027DFB4DE|nr:hypothetical protein [Nocardioides sp. LHD-245]